VTLVYRFKNRLKSILRKPWRALGRLPRHSALILARSGSRLLPFFKFELDSLYPPEKLSVSTVEWVSEFGESIGAKIHHVDPTYRVNNPLPTTIHKQVRRQLAMDQAFDCPDTFVAVIPNGRVIDDGLIITPDNQLLDDISVNFIAPELKLATIRRNWVWHPIVDINGSVAVLATGGAMLYYHWLFQLLPRFELIRRAQIDVTKIDYFVVNSKKHRFQCESLKALDIEQHKIIESSSVRSIRASTLIVPSVPLWSGCFAPWMCDFLRRTFVPSQGSVTLSTRRLYISRRNAGYRRVLNEREVIRLLNQFGFEEVHFESLSMHEQAIAMLSAEAVIAPHGGGLSNLVFCRPATKVIEIFSPELVAGYFWKLSNHLGLDYYYLLGKGQSAVSDPNYSQTWNSRSDIVVDLGDLRSTLTLANIPPVIHRRSMERSPRVGEG
jgi:hypothetical protein